MSAVRSGGTANPKLLDQMVKDGKIKSWEKALYEKGPKKGQERGKAFKITFNDGSFGSIEGRGTNIASSTFDKILKGSKVKNIENLLKTFRKVPIKGIRFNKGGQVPGMQYFAANNRQRVVQEAYNAASGIRRRVRPGRDQRFSQQAVLKDYVHDANFIRNSKDPEDMNTLLGMMKPLTQKTRATRGTVLGSTNNPELPYAQQKRIVAAIKEGRYEDLFGMRLNFRGPGSYTTRRETDFAPFIGDLSNPTLKSFSNGFMTLKSQKEEVAQLRKIIRSGKFKKEKKNESI